MAKSTKKFKDSEADFRKICSDITARKFAPIYLLTGEESYFIDVISEKLSSSILNETERPSTRPPSMAAILMVRPLPATAVRCR